MQPTTCFANVALHLGLQFGLTTNKYHRKLLAHAKILTVPGFSSAFKVFWRVIEVTGTYFLKIWFSVILQEQINL